MSLKYYLVKFLIVVLLFFSACSTIDEKDLTGKWYAKDSHGYMELWIKEGKALSYLGKVDEILIYDYSIRQNHIHFSLQESNWDGYYHEFSLEITTLSNGELTVQSDEQDGSSNNKTYRRLSTKLPEINAELLNSIKVKNEIQSRIE